MPRLAAAAFALLVASAMPLRADDARTGFLDKVFKGADGKEVKYVVFVPADYKGDKAYPVILFLHGAGETGTDGKRQAQVGLGNAIRKGTTGQTKAKGGEDFPFIVVFPQAQQREKGIGQTWYSGRTEGDRALAILAEVQKQYKTDDQRVYLTGLSMGGYGTWQMAFKHPDRWAAIVPVCGGGDPKAAEKFKDLPCWAFHGDQDNAVPVQRSRDMIEALKKAGGMPKYTEYPGVPHNSWDKAYGTPELYQWLLSHKKK